MADTHKANGSVTGCVNSGNISAPMDRLVVDKAGGIVCSFGDGALNSSMNDASVQLASCTNSGAVSGAYAGGIPRLGAPVCPHMGGKLRYDPESQRWECPCHGSTFTTLGQNLDGPAMQDAQVSARQR